MTLRAARVNCNLTQAEAAAMIGISRATLASYEQGKTFPKVDTALKACELYGVDYNEVEFTAGGAME